jgi:ABC-type dipeptide/oligopeptide/nickel transport system permease component
MNSNSDSSNSTFQLAYLNLSSNRLTTLDLASMKWLNQATAVTDLTANPWNCDCSVLLEVWRELKHKLTLQCASPGHLLGKSWDVMEEFCSLVGGPFVVTIALIVNGVLLICAIGMGLILIKLLKKKRKQQKTTKYCDVNSSSAPHISLNLYAERGAGPSQVTAQSYADIGKRHHTSQFSPIQT